MSILSDVKKHLGVETEETAFDTEIIMDVNSVLRILNQLGVGNDLNVSSNEEWGDFTSDEILQSAIKPYVYLKVRKIFDPATSSVISNAYDGLIDEYEWRITVMVDSMKESGSISEDNW